MESLRFTTRQIQRNRPKQTHPQQPYDPRLAMRSRHHPFVPLPPNKMVMPQGVLPPPAPPSNVPAAPAVMVPARVPTGACFHSGQNGHFARECPNRDQARKPLAPSEPEGVKVTAEDTTDGILEGYPGIYQCTNCGVFDHAGVQCGEHTQTQKPNDELAYNRWAEVESAGVAAHTVPLEDDRVLMLHPTEPPAFHTPLTITCGAKLVQTCLEPTTFDPQGRTLISIHLLLAAEQVRRPTLTLAKLWVELSILYTRVELTRPKEWYVPGESETLTTYSPVPVCATMDGVDVKFEACVVVDVFPPGICLGPQELKCYNINHQEPTCEARIDERASLVVSFVVPHAAPIPLEVKDLWGASACESLGKILKEFDDLFMKHKADIGRCTIAKHTVEVEPGAVPHREGACRMSPEKTERANQEVRNLLALGMIRPSLSPWASGIVMVKKKNGELRFCCDFRPLNEVTIKDAYPLPRIDEILARLGKAKIYTSIDLAWAFWQIPVRKADRHKTAFACELGLFEWRRMPFGMCNASATFQQAIAILSTAKAAW